MTTKFKGVPEYKAVYEHIDKNFDKYIEEERKYLRVKCISATGEGMQEGAEATAKTIRAIGAEAKIVPLEGGHPAVYGKIKSKNPKAKTLMVYSFYDVVPIEHPEMWKFPPFAAEMVDAEKIGAPTEMGKVIVARGAHDKKGVHLPFIMTVGAIKEVTGDIPVNVLFVIEGEEEIYTPNLKQFVDKYYDELNKADAIWSPGSYRQLPSGLLIIHPGYNGFMQLDLTVEGGAWGGATGGRTPWSGYVSFLDQPMLRLVQALNTMFDSDGKVLVEGFYDNWLAPTPEQRRDIEKCKERFGDTSIMDDLSSVKRFKGGLPPEELLEDFLTAPHIIPIGINSGYITLSYIPAKATARLHVRFCPNMTSEEILQKVRKHLYTRGFPEIEVHCTKRTETGRGPASADVVQAVVRMAEIHGVDYVIWPSSPATCGIHFFAGAPLYKPVVCGSLGHGSRFHAPNEYITVEGMRDQMKGLVTFLHEYANM